MTNNPENMPELEPCPFCGSEGLDKITSSHSQSAFIGCGHCQFQFGGLWFAENDPFVGDGMKATIKSWNTRANDALAEENKRLRDALSEIARETTQRHYNDEDTYPLMDAFEMRELAQEALNQTKGKAK